MGMHITDHDVDFAALARGFGVYAEGPIEQPEDLRLGLERTLQVVRPGKATPVDVVTPEFWGLAFCIANCSLRAGILLVHSVPCP